MFVRIFGVSSVRLAVGYSEYFSFSMRSFILFYFFFLWFFHFSVHCATPMINFVVPIFFFFLD